MKIGICGDTRRAEFREIERDARLASSRYGAELWRTPSLFAASNRFARDVDFFLLCRSYPNEFCARDVEGLRRLAPLAPIALICGYLCEGEDRMGERFFGTRRFYCPQWRALGRAEFELFLSSGGAAGLFATSPLETAVDVLSRVYPAESTPARFATPRESVLVVSDDLRLCEITSDLLIREGYFVSTAGLHLWNDANRLETQFSRVIVDADDLSDPRFLARLRALRGRYRAATFDILAFSPRVDEIAYYEDSRRWGIARVHTKPFDVDHLVNFR